MATMTSSSAELLIGPDDHKDVTLYKKKLSALHSAKNGYHNRRIVQEMIAAIDGNNRFELFVSLLTQDKCTIAGVLLGHPIEITLNPRRYAIEPARIRFLWEFEPHPNVHNQEFCRELLWKDHTPALCLEPLLLTWELMLSSDTPLRCDHTKKEEEEKNFQLLRQMMQAEVDQPEPDSDMQQGPSCADVSGEADEKGVSSDASHENL
jgi:hypothetical protein